MGQLLGSESLCPEASTFCNSDACSLQKLWLEFIHKLSEINAISGLFYLGHSDGVVQPALAGVWFHVHSDWEGDVSVHRPWHYGLPLPFTLFIRQIEPLQRFILELLGIDLQLPVAGFASRYSILCNVYRAEDRELPAHSYEPGCQWDHVIRIILLLSDLQ